MWCTHQANAYVTLPPSPLRWWPYSYQSILEVARQELRHEHRHEHRHSPTVPGCTPAPTPSTPCHGSRTCLANCIVSLSKVQLHPLPHPPRPLLLLPSQSLTQHPLSITWMICYTLCSCFNNRYYYVKQIRCYIRLNVSFFIKLLYIKHICNKEKRIYIWLLTLFLVKG